MKIENLHPRICDITSKGMSEGFVMDDIYIENEKDLVTKLREGIPYFNADINIGMSEYNGEDALGGGLIPKTISDENLKEFSYDNEYHYWTEWYDEEEMIEQGYAYDDDGNEYQLENNKWVKIEKPTHRVWAEVTTTCYVDVVAKTKEEALEIADSLDGGDFYTDDSGTWNLTYADEL